MFSNRQPKPIFYLIDYWTKSTQPAINLQCLDEDITIKVARIFCLLKTRVVPNTSSQTSKQGMHLDPSTQAKL